MPRCARRTGLPSRCAARRLVLLMYMAAARTTIAAAVYLSFLFKTCPRVEDAFARQHFCSICGGAPGKPKRMALQLARGLSVLNSPVTLPQNGGRTVMKQLRIGDITIDAVIEREGPWRRPQDFFPAYDEAVFRHHLAGMEPEVFDTALGLIVITYQTFVVRTPRYTILVDTCTGEDKGHPPPFDFPGKERWRNELFALGISYEKVDYVFCTHLHIDHTGWNTTLRDGRWVPTFPNAKYVFHKKEYAVWEAEHNKGANPPGTVFRDNCLPIVEAGQVLLVDDDYALDDTITLTPTPGHSPCHCCVNIFSRGQRAVVTGDMMHHAIQCREVDWSPGVDWDPKQAAMSRRRFLSSVADTDTLLLPIH